MPDGRVPRAKTKKSLWPNAALGSIVTLVLSFMAFSPLLGGGVAGWLQRESPKRGAKVGAISGAIALVPLMVIIFLGLFVMMLPGGFGPSALLLLVLFVGLPLLGLWVLGLSTLGGYLGAYLREEHHSPDADNDVTADRTA